MFNPNENLTSFNNFILQLLRFSLNVFSLSYGSSLVFFSLFYADTHLFNVFNLQKYCYCYKFIQDLFPSLTVSLQQVIVIELISIYYFFLSSYSSYSTKIVCVFVPSTCLETLCCNLNASFHLCVSFYYT